MFFLEIICNPTVFSFKQIVNDLFIFYIIKQKEQHERKDFQKNLFRPSFILGRTQYFVFLPFSTY